MKKQIMVLGLILVTALFILGCSGNESSNSKEPATATTDDNSGLVSIPLDSVTNKVQKFDYNAKGVTVTYFAVRGSDGKVRTAFDACDVCGGKKGYKQQGTDIACINCGKVFKIDGLGTQNKGYGCWPSYLGHKIENGNVMIKTSEIEEGAFRFA
jgi:uncharacterized membrane protein